MNKRFIRRAGVTLVELMIVLAILIVIAGVGVVAYTRIQRDAEKKAAKALIANTAQAVTLFQATMSRFPTTEEGLQILITAPDDEAEAEKWAGPYLKDGKIPLDPWANELMYEFVEADGDDNSIETFHIWSTGPNKDDENGEGDDIKNWSSDNN